MTETLTFRYMVVEGDNTAAFDILDTRSNNRQKYSTAFVRPAAAEVRRIRLKYQDVTNITWYLADGCVYNGEKSTEVYVER